MRKIGLFTFAHSPKHKYSALNEDAQDQAPQACHNLTDSIYEGLDLASEIQSVKDQNLGDTVLLLGGDRSGTKHLSSLERWPQGRGPKAGSTILDACDALAAGRSLQRIEAGMNLNRSQAYRQMRRRGFRTNIQGVAMHKA